MLRFNAASFVDVSSAGRDNNLISVRFADEKGTLLIVEMPREAFRNLYFGIDDARRRLDSQ